MGKEKGESFYGKSFGNVWDVFDIELSKEECIAEVLSESNLFFIHKLMH